jgi:hypothetical protein
LLDDERYEKAVSGIKTQLTLRDTIQHTLGVAEFPEELKLKNLPATIMSYFTKEDKRSLFPTHAQDAVIINKLQSDDALGTAIVNIFRSKNTGAREIVDKFCPGCGKYGHEVFHNGCNFCDQFLLASDFLQRHPNSKTKILEKNKGHQQKRKDGRLNASKGSNQYKNDRKQKSFRSQKQPYNLRSNRGRIQMLQDVIEGLDEGDTEDASSVEEYVDANADAASDSCASKNA